MSDYTVFASYIFLLRSDSAKTPSSHSLNNVYSCKTLLLFRQTRWKNTLIDYKDTKNTLILTWKTKVFQIKKQVSVRWLVWTTRYKYPNPVGISIKLQVTTLDLNILKIFFSQTKHKLLFERMMLLPRWSCIDRGKTIRSCNSRCEFSRLIDSLTDLSVS